MAQQRLCFVAHKFKKNDGQGRVNYEIVRAALAAGYHVTVLGTQCADEIRTHPSAHFVALGSDKVPTELLRNLLFANKTAAYLRKHCQDFDLIQANGFVTWERCDVVAAHFVHSAWRQSGYYPFLRFSPYSLYQRLYTFLNRRWERTAFCSAKRVVAVAPNLEMELTSIGVQRSRIRVIPNGVDTDIFQPGKQSRAALGLPSQGTIALFVGDIRTPRKNLDTVLRALAHVPQLSLAVAGASEGSPYPALADQLHVAERVTFLGKVSNIDDVMRSVDLFVFPSRYEAHPLVLLEAMASGLPSAVSENFGAKEFLGEAGLTFQDPNDVKTLATLLQQLTDAPELRRALGHKARERALTMPWSAMADAYLAVYRELLN